MFFVSADQIQNFLTKKDRPIPGKYKRYFGDVKPSLRKGEEIFPFIQIRFCYGNIDFTIFSYAVKSQRLNHSWSGL